MITGIKIVLCLMIIEVTGGDCCCDGVEFGVGTSVVGIP